MRNHGLPLYCHECGIEIKEYKSRKILYCKRCAMNVANRQVREKNKRNAELRDKIRKASIKLETGGNRIYEYEDQQMVLGGNYKLSGYKLGAKLLPRICAKCEQTDPPCGFAPAFSVGGLEENLENCVENTALLCQQCYNDYTDSDDIIIEAFYDRLRKSDTKQVA